MGSGVPGTGRRSAMRRLVLGNSPHTPCGRRPSEGRVASDCVKKKSPAKAGLKDWLLLSLTVKRS